MTMKNVVSGISIFLCLLLASCSLNAHQEQTLNASLSKFLAARNEGSAMAYVAYTYPALVAEYHKLGDSVFKQKFDLTNDSIYGGYLRNGTIHTIKERGKLIQILYNVDYHEEEYSPKDPEPVHLYAVSEDDGENWFFLEENDYLDTARCKELRRLIK